MKNILQFHIQAPAQLTLHFQKEKEESVFVDVVLSYVGGG